LDELAIVAALAVAATVVLSKLRVPAMAGLLAAGALLGPYGLRLATSVDAIEDLAEMGVVLLLFSIGLEFSLRRLRAIFRQLAVGGLIQVGLTVAVTLGAAVALGEPIGRAIFYGFAFALSSTAIVLRSLTERGELDTPHGRFIVGALIFQDLCVVPMVLIVPLLRAGDEPGHAALSIGFAMGKAALVVIGTLAVSRFIVPNVLGWVDASRSREVFLLAILGLCIGTAWLTSLAGLSLALGAFLGGMVVADTEYGHRALGDILPLRDAFVSIFFVSLGMLFDVRVVAAQPVLVAVLFAGIVFAKGLVATLAALALALPSRVAWLAGVGLAQFGEFGFVLTRLAEANRVIDASAARPLLTAGIASMIVAPVLIRMAPHTLAGERLLAPLQRWIGIPDVHETAPPTQLENHVVVVGFGLAGLFAARILRDCDMPFVVLELNVNNVRKGRELGLPVFYADATRVDALRHVRVERARLVVLLMNDPHAARRVVDTVKRVAPDAAILMRTRYLSERGPLLELGAHDVVAEEVEGAVEIIARMLRSIEVPRNVIDQRIRDVRSETQTSERRQTLPRSRLSDVSGLRDMKIECARVHESSRAAGASAVQLALRTKTGALVVGVRRGSKLLDHPDPTAAFEPGDLVYFVGTSEALSRALPLFSADG
ncbi:MAG TPA: cation:proton antiporter, partial [Polyangiales bacterium]|nr:cation:proton antiporter [Polyangiales bacterium]